jgi:RHS repeat-associated protein
MSAARKLTIWEEADAQRVGLRNSSAANDNAVQALDDARENSRLGIFVFPHTSLPASEPANDGIAAAKSEALRRSAAEPGITGKEEDVEVGLQYFGKRYLNPLLGRWISADPLAVHAPGSADLNLYAYVSGRALKNVDPLGLQSDAPSADMSDDVTVQDMEAYDADNTYLADLEGDVGSDQWMSGFEEMGNKEEAKRALEWAERRQEYINAPLTPQEQGAMNYVQEAGGNREQFMAFRSESRAWMIDNMTSFDIASNGALRKWSNEVERNKSNNAAFKHWAGWAQDWQPIMGPAVFQGEADWKSRMVSIENLKRPEWNTYNNAMADVAESVGLKPGFRFTNTKGEPSPHPEHFEQPEFKGQKITPAMHELVRTGAEGLDAKPIDRTYSQESPNASVAK